jgi:hypothetical protein
MLANILRRSQERPTIDNGLILVKSDLGNGTVFLEKPMKIDLPDFSWQVAKEYRALVDLVGFKIPTQRRA